MQRTTGLHTIKLWSSVSNITIVSCDTDMSCRISDVLQVIVAVVGQAQL